MVKNASFCHWKGLMCHLKIRNMPFAQKIIGFWCDEDRNKHYICIIEITLKHNL